MIVNQLPNTLEGISEKYFPKIEDRTQFQKDVEYNMKMASGLSPAVSNEELTEQTNLQYEEDFYAGSEQALIDPSNRNDALTIAELAQTLGAINRNDDNISLTDYYTNSEIAKNLQSDDVVRINVTNSVEDIPQYMTKYNYLQMKLTESFNNLKPNYGRIAARFGIPIVSNLSSAALTASGATTSPVGLAAVVGLQTIGAGYDIGMLGDTIYNTQLEYNNRMSNLLSDSNVTNEEWVKHVDNFIKHLNDEVPDEYKQEIYMSLLEGPDPYADSGGPATALAIQTYGQPLKGLLGLTTKVLPRMLPDRVKVNEMNKRLAEKIMEFKSNKVKPETTDEIYTDIANNEKIHTNDNVEYNSFFSDTPREPMAVTSLPVDTGLQVVGKNKTLRSDERGEIKFGESEQTVNILHGRGTNNEPMTFEEARQMMHEKTSVNSENWDGLAFSKVNSIEYNPESENEYISISTASGVPFEGGKIMYKEHHGSGEGGEGFLAGTYGSLEADPHSAAKYHYYPTYKEKSWDYTDRMEKETLKYAVENKLLPKLKNDALLYSRARRFSDLFGGDEIAYYNTALLAFKTPYKILSEKNIPYSEELNMYSVFDNLGGFSPLGYVSTYREFLNKDVTESYPSPEAFIKRSEKAFEEFLKQYEKFKDLASKQETSLEEIESRLSTKFLEDSGELNQLEKTVLSMKRYLSTALKHSYTGNAMMIFNKLDNRRRTGYLNSLGVKNPLKNPEGHLIYNLEIGLRPFVDVLKGDKKELAKLKEQEYNRFMSIKDDILKANPKAIPEVLGSYLDEYFKPGMSLYRFRSDISTIYPGYQPRKRIDFYSDKAYNEWEKDYLTSKGYIANWHNGGGSKSTNVVIIDDSKATPVIKEETNIETGPYEVKLGESGHTPIRDGNGRGWYLLERHQMKGDKPILVRNGRVVEE